MKLTTRIRHIVGPRRLQTTLVVSSVMSGILVLVSVWIYYAAGYATLDLSRPGFEKQRGELVDIEPQLPYDSTGPITEGVVKDFLKEYDERAASLKAFGDFKDSALGDKELQIQ